MIYKQPHMHHELRVAAGSQAFKPVFKNTAADNVGEGYCTNK